MEKPSQKKEIFVFSKKGDSGETSLLSGERVPKHHIRPETYGTLDEASSALGIARSLTALPELKNVIIEIQNLLVTLGAELASSRQDPRYQITEDHIARLERWIEEFQEKVPLPRRFILPGDSLTGAVLDLARTIVRRAERRCSEIREKGEFIRAEVSAFLNRLADLLFVMARYADALEKTESGR